MYVFLLDFNNVDLRILDVFKGSIFYLLLKVLMLFLAIYKVVVF